MDGAASGVVELDGALVGGEVPRPSALHVLQAGEGGAQGAVDLAVAQGDAALRARPPGEAEALAQEAHLVGPARVGARVERDVLLRGVDGPVHKGEEGGHGHCQERPQPARGHLYAHST